jgi:hypothetical protein
MKTYRGKHVHVFTTVFGSTTIAGRRYTKYQACTRCKATRKP